MKNKFQLRAFVILLFTLRAFGQADLYVNLVDHGLGLSSATNRVVIVTGNSLPRGISGGVVMKDSSRYTTDVEGGFWHSNCVEGVYFIDVIKPSFASYPASRTTFYVLVTNTTGVVYARENITADPGNTYPPDTVAWGAAASDRRYLRKSDTNLVQDLSLRDGSITNKHNSLVTFRQGLNVTNSVSVLGGGSVATEASGLPGAGNVLAGSGGGSESNSVIAAKNVYAGSNVIAGAGQFFGHLGGTSNAPPAIATNNATATNGMVLSRTGDAVKWVTDSGVSATEVAAIVATNGQPVDLQKQWPLPLIAFDTWATWQASVHELYSTNVAAWATNLANTLYTNGLAKSVGTVIWIDDGWVVTNRVNNRIMWNTNMFPMGMTNLAKMVHSKNSKLFLYSSRATNTCAGLVGSPTNYVYQDIQDMMSWGIDGCFFDTCNNTVEQDAQYSTVWTKLAQQSISDFQIATYSTQGVVMPFYLNTTTGNGAESPGQQHAVAQFFNVVNALGWNWTDQASTLTSYVAQAKETLKFLGPYIRPGFYPDALRVYAPNMVDNTYFLPAMIPLAMTCQQLRIGAGDRSNPAWPVTNHTASTYDAGYPYWQMTNSILPMLGNTKLMEVWLDPLVSPATIVWTNQATELWVKRLVDQNRKAVSLMNLASTNCTVSINVKDFGGASNVAYTVWNTLSNSTETVFANQFSYTLAPTNAVLFTIEPAESSQKVFANIVSDTRWEAVSWKEMNFTGTGLSQQTVAATMGSPFAPLSEGMYQSAANNFWQHGVPLPAWATNVTLAYCVYSDFAGTVAWTNAVRVYSYQLTGAQTTLADTNWTVVTTSGTATWITNIATFATTNIPREVVVTFGGSSNSSPRRVIGPMFRRFY